MRKLVGAALFVVSLLVSLPLKAQEPLPNLAYTQDFAWYLSGRLAHDMVELGKRAGAFDSDQDAEEVRRDYEMIYFHLIVECGGPLPQLAEVLRFYTLDPVPGQVGALAYVGTMEPKIGQVARAWNAKVFLRVLERLRSGRFIILPTCVEDGFLRQNPAFLRPSQ